MSGGMVSPKGDHGEGPGAAGRPVYRLWALRRPARLLPVAGGLFEFVDFAEFFPGDLGQFAGEVPVHEITGLLAGRSSPTARLRRFVRLAAFPSHQEQA